MFVSVSCVKKETVICRIKGHREVFFVLSLFVLVYFFCVCIFFVFASVSCVKKETVT